jgi:hypothetical protein
MLARFRRWRVVPPDSDLDRLNQLIRLGLNPPMNWRWMGVGMNKVPSELG